MEKLPNEIVIKILSYLKTKDILEFLKVFTAYSYFLKEKHVVEFFSLRNMFELNNINVCQFISCNVAYNFIKVLNIDGLYWLPLNDVRELVSKLQMLEELYAIDTKLGIRAKDIILYGQLKKLSLSVETNQMCGESSNFYSNWLIRLTKLCLKFNFKENDFVEIYGLFTILRQLQELWIYDNCEQGTLNFERIILNLPRLNKLVIKSKRPIAQLDLTSWGFNKVFLNKGCEFSTEAIFDNNPSVNTKLTVEENFIAYQISPVEEAWQIFKNLHCEMPWGPKDFEV